MCRCTNRKAHKKKILHHITPPLIPNPHCSGPSPPISTPSITLHLPATKRAIEIKPPSILHVRTNPHLQIPQPIAHDIYPRRDTPHTQARGDEDPPDLALIHGKPQLPYQPRRSRNQHPLPLPLFAVLIDPINSRQIIVSHPPPRALDIPVQTRGVFGVRAGGVRVRGPGVQVGEDGVWGCGASVRHAVGG